MPPAPPWYVVDPPSYVVGPAGTTCTSLGLSPLGDSQECQAAAGELPAAARTSGKYAGEWSDGDGDDWGYPHGCHTSMAEPEGAIDRYLPDVRWNNADHTPGYSGYYMGRPVCRGPSWPSAVREVAYPAPPPAGARSPLLVLDDRFELVQTGAPR